MKATITNVVKEGDRVRIFVSYSDSTEGSFLVFPNATEESIRAEISSVLRDKEQAESDALDLANRLKDQVIE